MSDISIEDMDGDVFSENPTGRLRFLDARLQQEWEVRLIRNHGIARVTHEWRYVPADHSDEVPK